MGDTIAGHVFEDGVCVATKADGTGCGRKWLDIQHCGRDDIDKLDIAHSGKLNSYEADQIIAAKKKQDDQWDVLFNHKGTTMSDT